MKYIALILFLFPALVLCAPREIKYCIKNEQVIGSNYEFDVCVKTDTAGTLLGDGIFYINYNSIAFGSSVITSGGLTVVRDSLSYILGDKVAGIIFVYSANGLLTNNNSSSRFAVSWEVDQMAFAHSLLVTEEVLVHCRIKIVSAAEPPSVTLHESLMEQETYESTNVTALTVNLDTCTTQALPVEGLELMATSLNDQAVQLDWLSLQEVNSHYYGVEKMQDQQAFVEIGRVPAAGISSSIRNYQYIDRSTMSPVMYYRLRQVDVDGQFGYSNTVLIRISGPEVPLVYPVPVYDLLHIDMSMDDNGPVHFSLYDQVGRLILEADWPSSKELSPIDLSKLAAGSYSYEIQTGQDSWSGKIVKFNR